MKVKDINELARVSIEEFKQLDKIPLTIVLENVRSLNNVGAIFRTSDAFRVSEIICCGITGTPPHTDIHKTALGAEDAVAWTYRENMPDCIIYLKQEGFVICVLEQAFESISLDNLYQQLSLEHKYALIVGNEVMGVEQSTVDRSDLIIEIPQSGTKHSLNVSVATSLAIWEFYKFFNI